MTMMMTTKKTRSLTKSLSCTLNLLTKLETPSSITTYPQLKMTNLSKKKSLISWCACRNKKPQWSRRRSVKFMIFLAEQVKPRGWTKEKATSLLSQTRKISITCTWWRRQTIKSTAKLKVSSSPAGFSTLIFAKIWLWLLAKIYSTIPIPVMGIKVAH